MLYIQNDGTPTAAGGSGEQSKNAAANDGHEAGSLNDCR
jgi:hypothetical protein